jgi:cysteine desulfurase
VNYQRIYLDNAATTALRTEVIDAMRDAVSDGGFNPSSLHAEGRRARAVLDSARDRVAAAIGARRTDIIFTAGGTEADNLALLGATATVRPPAHLVASVIEHHAVLESLEHLRDRGYEITLLPVGNSGVVRPQDFAAALRPHTALASIMYANNEIGTVQPISELAAIARQHGVLFHTDAVAAACWMPLDVKGLGVDLLSLSAHKFGGPKGVGALYVRDGVVLRPLVHGGGQELGKRAGTENVIGIAGMARALELTVAERPVKAPQVEALRDRLEAGIRSAVPDIRVNGEGASRVANNLNVSFAGLESAALLIALDLVGVAVSAGSACTSGVLEPSHVLAALGAEPRWQNGAIRFSLGSSTSAPEVERVLSLLTKIVHELRMTAPAA